MEKLGFVRHKKRETGKRRRNDLALVGIRPDRRLLQPGWAGQLSDSEIEYIRRELKRHPRLWRRWGYDGAMMEGIPIPASTIRRIAVHGLS